MTLIPNTEEDLCDTEHLDFLIQHVGFQILGNHQHHLNI